MGAAVIQGCFLGAVLGAIDRLLLNDARWARISGLVLGRPEAPGSTGRDNRMFVEGVLWIVRTGAPWRDLPEAFGRWNSAFRRFSRWAAKGVWAEVFRALAAAGGPPAEVLLDSTHVKAHRCAAGGKGGNARRRSASAGAAAPP